MNDTKKYYKDINKLFPIHSKRERAYLKDLKEQIEEYDNCTYKELEEVFGTPIEVVNTYYTNVDSKYLLKKLKIKRFITIICTVIFLSSIVYLGYETYVLYNTMQRFDQDIPTQYDEQIIDYGNDEVNENETH